MWHLRSSASRFPSGSIVCLPRATSLLCYACSNVSSTKGFLEHPTAVDSSGMEVLCKNSTYGCIFASSSIDDMVNHFQSACTFHPLQCFKCSKMVSKIHFTKHYELCCKDSSASPCPLLQEVPCAAEAKASGITVPREEHHLQGCVRESTLSVECLSRVMKDVAAVVAETEVIKEKQQDLEAIAKGQGDVIQELGKSITIAVENVNKVQEDVSRLVNWLEKDKGAIVERVENVDSLVKTCNKECKLRVLRLSRVMKDVTSDVAEIKLMREEQNLEASVKQQGDFLKELWKSMVMNAEKVNNMEQGIGTIVQRVEQVDGLVKEVRGLTRRLAHESKVHWYVENVSQYIEKGKKEQPSVQSDVFVLRGYSVRLSFKVVECVDLYIALYLRLCRGPNDSLLQWPFRIPFTLSLIHPKHASKIKQFKITPSSTDPQCFEKPKSEENTGRGTRNLCTVEAALNEGFIENDAVCFALILHE